MVTYEFYWRDPIKGYQILGTLPERRRNPARITQESVMNWGEKYFDKSLKINGMIFFQVTIDKDRGRIFRLIQFS